MKKSKLLFAISILTLVQGCSLNNFPFLSNSAKNNIESSYDEDYMTDTVKPPVYAKDSEDEIPVQMTHKDTQLNTLKPESTSINTPDNNVLLPLSEGLE